MAEYNIKGMGVMKKNISIEKLICCIVIVMMLTGCGAITSSSPTDSPSNSTSTETTVVPDESAEAATTEGISSEKQSTDIEYSQGDIPRIYITTANYQNKLNSYNNLALDKKVTVKSYETDNLREAYLIDGNIDTRWASCYEDTEFFLIDLGNSEKFSYIKIKWESAFGKEYTISVSDDNTNWVPIINEKNGSPGDMDYSFNEVSARYIKWQGIKRGTDYGYSIFEFGVYKDSTLANTASAVSGDYPYLSTFTDEYQPISITIIDSLGGGYPQINDDNATICIRGNSTSLTNKKSYNFKLSAKKDVLGLAEGKKWCVLANHFDKTMIRNKISYDFAEALNLPVKLETAFVEIYIDGVYEGVYLLSEPVSDGKNRVDIDINNGEFIFERCAYVEKVSQGMIQSPVFNLNFNIKSPDADVVTNDQKTQLIDFLGRVEEAIMAGDSSVMEKVMDLDSFASMYVFEELFKNVDYTFDTNYYYVKGDKLYAGPIWDMDLSMGNVSCVYDFRPYYIYNNSVIDQDIYGNGSGDSTEGFWAASEWYQALMTYDFFQQLVDRTFDQVETSFEQLYIEGGVIDQLVNQYGAAFERNYCDTYWSLTKAYSKYEREAPESTYSANVEYLKNWLKKRKKWIYENR